MKMIVHIKTSNKVDDNLISELMGVLIKYGFKTEKYLGIGSKIVMARKGDIL